MKRYELIKEYPGSPKKGEVVKLSKEGNYYVDSNESHYFKIDYIEDNPEFYKTLDYKFILSNSQNEVFRASDGSTFKVGQYVTEGKIKNFKSTGKEDTEKILVVTDGSTEPIDLETLIAIKEPFIITELGNIIQHKNQEVYVLSESEPIGIMTAEAFLRLTGCDYKCFITKADADNWLEDNKKVYSKINVNDILQKVKSEILEIFSDYLDTLTVNRLDDTISLCEL